MTAGTNVVICALAGLTWDGRRLFSFKTKICGVTSVTDAQSAIESGADAVGLNFYPLSRRYISPEQAFSIRQSLESSATLFIGVFVNCPEKQVADISKRVGLDAIQLHGDESPEVVSTFGLPVIRAVRFQGLGETQAEIEKWIEAGVAVILLDADAGLDYGGTGKKIDWQQAGQLTCSVPLILAGGLNSQNVGQAIVAVRPDGVDVASGVEITAGNKNRRLMREFVANACRVLG